MTLRLTAIAALLLTSLGGPVYAADKTEGVGQGLSVTLIDDLGNKHLRWEFRPDRSSPISAALLEKAEACRKPVPGTRIEERRGGVTVTRFETAGRTIFEMGEYCLEGTGTVDTLLKAMELHSADQLLPLAEARRFQDRVPMLRKLLAWQRSKADEADGRFAVGPFQLEVDYASPEAMLQAMGGSDFEISPRPSAYGQGVTILQPAAMPQYSAIQVSLARSGLSVRPTQAVALIDAPAATVVADLTRTLGAPGKTEQAEKAPVQYRWQRGPLVMELEALGTQARLVWRDTRCTTGPCNPPPIEGLYRLLKVRQEAASR